MEKLIELLNEYRTEKGERNLNEFEVSQTLDSLNYLRLFIQWLVDNNKIDWDFNELKPIMLDPGCDLEEWLYGEEVDKVDLVLMYLSIQENPLEFLIDILK